jgi:hypothetical protein
MFMVSGILGITDIHIEIRSKIELDIMANHKEFKKYRVEYLLKGFLFSCPQVVSCTQFSPAR